MGQSEWVRASGRVLGADLLLASRVESFTPSPAQSVQYTSRITSVDGNHLFLSNEMLVDAATATHVGFSASGAGAYAAGQIVSVVRTVSNGVITATRIRLQETLTPYAPTPISNAQRLDVEGYITNFESNDQFKISNINIDASNAAFNPNFFTIEDGVNIRLSGALKFERILVADSVYFQDIIEEGMVIDVKAAENQLTVLI